MDKRPARVEVAELDWMVAAKRSNLLLEAKTYEVAFCGPTADPVVRSTRSILSAIFWSWLKWHLAPEFEPISRDLSFVVRRTAAMLTDRNPPDATLRPIHDRLLVCCAVLSGDRATMRAAAEAVPAPGTRSKHASYERALTGVLRARILGDAAEEVRQFRSLEKAKPDRIHLSPARGLVRALVERDYAALARAVREGVQRHWTDTYLNRGPGARGRSVVVSESAGRVVVELRNKHYYSFWPYPEAVLAKLAILDGADIDYDDFWFPIDFVKALAGPPSGDAAAATDAAPKDTAARAKEGKQRKAVGSAAKSQAKPAKPAKPRAARG